MQIAAESDHMLAGITPYDFMDKRWTSEPDRFIVNPIHQMPGLNTQELEPPANSARFTAQRTAAFDIACRIKEYPF